MVEEVIRCLSTQQRKFVKKMKDGVWYDLSEVFRGVRSREALHQKGIVEPKEYEGKKYDFMMRITPFGTEVRDRLLKQEYIRGRKIGEAIE